MKKILYIEEGVGWLTVFAGIILAFVLFMDVLAILEFLT